ncbi:MAG: TrkA family potassium uptake protein [Actinobacteria bacterium]|nr:MAG: TrkA family potassium uptake protein [Actinomycetota bacterium]
MFVLIVGAGRVGSSVARSALAAGHEVSVLDEDPLSHERLDAGMETSWEDAGGLFTVGHAIEADALEEAGIERADIFIASTDGDNTNLTISQIAKRGYGVERVVARIMDPYRAAWYAEQGLETICPTKIAIEQFTTVVAG